MKPFDILNSGLCLQPGEPSRARGGGEGGREGKERESGSRFNPGLGIDMNRVTSAVGVGQTTTPGSCHDGSIRVWRAQGESHHDTSVVVDSSGCGVGWGQPTELPSTWCKAT